MPQSPGAESPTLLRIMGGAPLFPVAAGLIAGVVLDHRLHSEIVVYLTLFAVTCCAAAFRAARITLGPLLILAVSVCAGGAVHLAAVRQVPPDSIERFTGTADRIARVRGTIASKPRVLTSGEGNPFARWTFGFGVDRTVFLLDAESIEGVGGDIPVTGLLRVTVREAVLDLRENEHVEVFGWLYRLRPPANPGAFDWALYHRRRGIVAGLSCKFQENVRRLDDEPAPPAPDPVTRLRGFVRGMLTGDLSTGTDEQASLLEAMVLGHRSGLDRRLNDVFIRAGCIHFLAVSGVHVVIVMFLARVLCRPFTHRPRSRTWIMIATVVLYVAIAEPRPPILRAGVIAVLYCIACLLGRQRACLNWISLSAIILVLVDPATVFGAGFQLSFAATLGVSYLTPAIVNIVAAGRAWWRDRLAIRALSIAGLKPRESRPDTAPRLLVWWRVSLRAFRRYAAVAIAVSMGAWLAALPIIAVHFQRVQPWGAVNSCLVFPLVTAVMGLGFAKLAASMLFPALAAYVAIPLTAADWLLIREVELLSLLPGVSIVVRSPPWWLIFAYYGFLLALVWRFAYRHQYYAHAVRKDDAHADSADTAVAATTEQESSLPAPAPGWSKPASVVALVALLLASAAWFRPEPRKNQLVVTALAVGAGSATVIELPDRRTMLYDAGSAASYDVGSGTVVPFLRERGIDRIAEIHISHPNLDHFSGIPSIMDEIPTDLVSVNRHFAAFAGRGAASRRLLRLLAERETPIKTLDSRVAKWSTGGVGFELLSPLTDDGESLSNNDTSTVLRLSFAGRSVLLTGDIAEHAQRGLLQGSASNLQADVLFLPHHGSMRPNPAELIRAVAPRFLIRSSNRRTGDSAAGLHRVSGEIPLYNTADVGAVQVVLDEDGVHVSCMRPCPGF